jgi:hypothetical protein
MNSISAAKVQLNYGMYKFEQRYYYMKDSKIPKSGYCVLLWFIIVLHPNCFFLHIGRLFRRIFPIKKGDFSC